MLKLKPALRNIDNIVWTEKTGYVKGLGIEDARMLIFHGSTGNGKSMIASLKLLSRIYSAPRDRQIYVLAGRDTPALERRFVESNRSVFNWVPFKGKWVYKKQGVGGARITVRTRTGNKYIYLTSFNNVSAYSRVLGETLDGILVDEAPESDEMFLQEIVARIIRTEGTFGIFTGNGGDPNHYFYTHMVNISVPIDEKLDEAGIENYIKTPPEELRYYEDDRNKNYLTVQMCLEDNPTYSKEQLEEFYRLYPAGSFMSNSRIFGIRGFTQNNPYSPYMDGEVFIKYEELVEKGFYPQQMTFSVDVGGHVFAKEDVKISNDLYSIEDWYREYNKGEHGTAKGGHTGMLTVGWSKKYKQMLILDIYWPNHMHDHINVERIFKRVYNISARFPLVKKPYMFCDPASPSFYSLLKDRRTGVGQVRQAIKRDNSINLDEKVVISKIQQYMMSGRFKILDTQSNRRWFYEAMLQATLESDGTLVDNKKEEADIQDMLKYSVSSMYRLLL